jgi:hypothetical protein
MVKWSEHSVKELRLIAKSYNKYVEIGDYKTMAKKELIKMLDKHLILDEMTGDVSLRKMDEEYLGNLKPNDKKSKKMAGEKEAAEVYAKLKPEVLKSSEQMKSASGDAMEIAKNAMEHLKMAMTAMEGMVVIKKKRTKKEKM